ncbi:hypothetical protein D3C85_1526090 [compost metagenome]
MVRSRMGDGPSIEWRILAITPGWGKADIRQIVGRDSVGGRESAIGNGPLGKGGFAAALVAKGFQWIFERWHGVCDRGERSASVQLDTTNPSSAGGFAR